MSNKTKAIIAVLALAGAYSAGRYLAPEKVKIETKTVEVEKRSTDTTTDIDRDKHRVTTVTEIERPDGTKERTTRTEEDTKTSKNTKSKTKEELVKEGTSTSETIRRGSRLTLSALCGFGFTGAFPSSLSSPIYGGHISKEILGPVSVGAWGLSNGTGGISVGLSL